MVSRFISFVSLVFYDLAVIYKIVYLGYITSFQERYSNVLLVTELSPPDQVYGTMYNLFTKVHSFKFLMSIK